MWWSRLCDLRPRWQGRDSRAAKRKKLRYLSSRGPREGEWLLAFELLVEELNYSWHRTSGTPDAFNLSCRLFLTLRVWEVLIEERFVFDTLDIDILTARTRSLKFIVGKESRRMDSFQIKAELMRRGFGSRKKTTTPNWILADYKYNKRAASWNKIHLASYLSLKLTWLSWSRLHFLIISLSK